MVYSIWLMFSDEDENYLKNIMKSLQNSYGGPKFNPHITVFGDIEHAPKKLEEFAKYSINRIRPFKVKNTKIEFSNNMFKAAYISLELNSILRQINQKLSERLSVFNDYTFLPHASLLYHVLSIEEQDEIKNKFEIKKELTVNRIAVQEITESISDWKTVSGPFYLGG